MASIIKNRAIVNDDWTVVRPAEDGSLPAVNELPAGMVLVPVAVLLVPGRGGPTARSGAGARGRA